MCAWFLTCWYEYCLNTLSMALPVQNAGHFEIKSCWNKKNRQQSPTMCFSLVAWISSYLCFRNRIASSSSSSSSISRMQWIYFQCEAYLVLFDRRIGRIEQHLKNVLVYFVSLPLSFSLTLWITAIWSFISVSRTLCFIHSLSHTHEHTLTRIHSLYSVYRIVYAVLRPPLLWINVCASCSIHVNGGESFSLFVSLL